MFWIKRSDGNSVNISTASLKREIGEGLLFEWPGGMTIVVRNMNDDELTRLAEVYDGSYLFRNREWRTWPDGNYPGDDG